MKIVFLIYILLHYFSQVNSFGQLIQPGITVATSSSVGWGGFANKTIDGNYSQNHYTNCMHTAGGHREAWLKIDLGDVYNLKNVTIWYRGDKKIESENTKRFKGFSIRLSKSPDLVSSEICYQDPGNESLPVMITRFCKGVARYVWFYTDKDNGGGVFLEICEVDVYGCQDKHYGENYFKCNGCNDICDIISEECSCTETGYRPPKCVKECPNQRYGPNCKSRCRNCKRGACDHVSGVCKNGCKTGWKGDKCDQPCSHGFYGWECRFRCGNCAKNAGCNHVNGSCPYGGCMPGFKQTDDQRCDKECDNGTFGNICEKKCSGHCAGGIPCNKTDGDCPLGCENGWISTICNETCREGFYGKKCSLSCGFCALNTTCDHVTGSCPSGLCQPGWKNTQDKRCDQECDNERFGKNCEETCEDIVDGGCRVIKSTEFVLVGVQMGG